MIRVGGYRSAGSWRYRVIKRYRRRARKFRDEGKTIEEKLAWVAVIKWFESILDEKQLNEKDELVLPFEAVEKFALPPENGGSLSTPEGEGDG